MLSSGKDFTRLCHFPNDTILDSSTLKDLAHGNLKFDGNGGKFSERVENTEGKGEISR